jgi:4'-phosphopantetheinyl transferase
MLTLDAQDVHCWILRTEHIDLNDDYVDKLSALLDVDESRRFKRFKFDQHRRQFAMAHAFTRQVLSHYADLMPADWVFEKNDYGKPFITNKGLDWLQFNLSHTKGMMLMAVSRLQPLGIDVEYRDPKVEGPRIAHRFFSEQEVADLHALDDTYQYHRFFDYWSLKESYIKACGKGLAIPLGKFSFTLRQTVSLATDPGLEEQGDGWCFHMLDVGEQHAAALAIGAGRDVRISLRSLLPLHNACDEILKLRDPAQLQVLQR